MVRTGESDRGTRAAGLEQAVVAGTRHVVGWGGKWGQSASDMEWRCRAQHTGWDTGWRREWRRRKKREWRWWRFGRQQPHPVAGSALFETFEIR